VVILVIYSCVADASHACKPTGSCEACSRQQQEAGEDFCVSTGSRVEWTCRNTEKLTRNSSNEITYKTYESCVEESAYATVLIFEGAVVVIGLLSCYLVRERKQRLQRLQFERLANTIHKDAKKLFS
jgi:hypothetical protein